MKGDELVYEFYSVKGVIVLLEVGYGFVLNKFFGLEAVKYMWIF